MSPDQQKVKVGAATAAIISIVFIYTGYQIFPFVLTPMVTIGDKLAFVIQCEIFALLMLVAGIAAVANQRFLHKEAIDGATIDLPISIQINLRYNQNTLEQFVLAVVAHLVLATVVEPDSLKIIPILVCWWIIGRIMFWIGYHVYPVGRAVGFGSTFYPTIGVIGYNIYRIISS